MCIQSLDFCGGMVVNGRTDMNIVMRYAYDTFLRSTKGKHGTVDIFMCQDIMNQNNKRIGGADSLCNRCVYCIEWECDDDTTINRIEMCMSPPVNGSGTLEPVWTVQRHQLSNRNEM